MPFFGTEVIRKYLVTGLLKGVCKDEPVAGAVVKCPGQVRDRSGPRDR